LQRFATSFIHYCSGLPVRRQPAGWIIQSSEILLLSLASLRGLTDIVGFDELKIKPRRLRPLVTSRGHLGEIFDALYIGYRRFPVLLRELTWVVTQTNTPAEGTVIDGKTSRHSYQTVCACFYGALATRCPASAPVRQYRGKKRISSSTKGWR